MANETYRIVAKHFAKTINVQLEFQEGANPSTDGRKILLPTEMEETLIDVTMGALLHETAHIRMTDFSYNNGNSGVSTEMMLCLNALEDIRIDHETFKLYPNARGFQGALIDHCIESAKTMQKIADEILACKILKAIIILPSNIPLNNLSSIIYNLNYNFY